MYPYLGPLINAYYERIRYQNTQLAIEIAEHVGIVLGLIKSQHGNRQESRQSSTPQNKQTFKTGSTVRGNNGKQYQVISPLSMKRLANARSA